MKKALVNAVVSHARNLILLSLIFVRLAVRRSTACTWLVSVLQERQPSETNRVLCFRLADTATGAWMSEHGGVGGSQGAVWLVGPRFWSVHKLAVHIPV